MIGVAQNTSPRPSDVVHHVEYASGGFTGFQRLCDAPWLVPNSTYHARVMTEVDPVGRTMVVSLTRDPVDCMACLVHYGRR